MTTPIASIADREPVSVITASGAQRTFDIDWPIRSAEHVIISLSQSNEDGDGLSYELQGVNDDAGFKIVFDVAPLEGTVVTVRRTTPFERTTGYAGMPARQFSPAGLDAEFNDQLLRMQEMRRDLRLKLTRPATWQAGKYLRMTDVEGVLEGADAEAAAPDDDTPNNDVVLYPADIGLDATPGVDNTSLLNTAIETLSAGGGGEIVLDGRAYEFQGRVLVRSFVTARNLKARLGPTAGIDIAGRKKVAHTGIRLVSAATAAATTMVWDTAPLGGGPISSYARIGSPISIVDGIAQESNTVTAIDDGARTVTLANGLQYDYSTDGATVTIEVAARCATNAGPRTDQIAIEAADIALLAIGDWVMIEDDRRTGGATTYLEIRQIVDIAGNTVFLSGQLRRQYLTAQRARLTVLEPARRAALIGPSFECIGVASATRYDSLCEVRYALDSVVIGAEYPGTDSVGRRGNNIRIHKSYNCHAIDCSGRNPLYTDEGEGNIGVIAYSTLCSMVRLYAQGARHGGQFIAATECAFLDGSSIDTLLTGFEGHGMNSVGCLIRAKDITFASRTASASNVAIVWGNATWLDGDHESLALDTRLGPFQGNSGVAAARIFTPSTYCFFKDIHGDDVQKFFIHRDTSGHGSLEVVGGGLINCSVRRCADRVIDIQGKAAGGAVASLRGFKITGFRGEALFRGILAYDADGLIIEDTSLEFSSPDASSERYALALKRVTGLRTVDLKSYGADRGIDLEDCPDALFLKADLLDLGDTQWLKDRGGNDDTEFRGCNAYTAAGSPATIDATGGSTIVYKATGNVGTETTTAYEFAGTYKVLGVAGSAGAGQELSFTADAQSLAAAANFAAMRTLLGLGIGSDIQAYDTELAAIAGLTSDADRLPYFNGAGTAALATFTGSARSLLDDGNFATMRQTLGVEIGVDVQAYSAKLAALAALTWANKKGLRLTGTGTLASFDLEDFPLTILDDTSAVAVLTTLGIKSTTLQIPFSGGGADIAAGFKLPVQVPWDVTVTGWRLVSMSGAGSLVIDIWKDTFANFPPDVSNTVTGTEKPTLSSAETAEDLNLTTWTDVSWDAGEWVVFNVDSCTGVQFATLVLLVDRR